MNSTTKSSDSVVYVGWMNGTRDDIQRLKELGVCGEMTYRELPVTLGVSIQRTILRWFGCRRKYGYIENCRCTEDVMDKLIAMEWEGFCASTFSAVKEERGQKVVLQGPNKYSGKVCARCRAQERRLKVKYGEFVA